MTQNNGHDTVNFNPLPPHGGRHLNLVGTLDHPDFNPLPPHGGRLLSLQCLCSGVIDISIHSLHTEGDAVSSAERATLQHFNPLPPHGGRLDNISTDSLTADISIHSLHTEGDSKWTANRWSCIAFQSTPSTRRETAKLHRKAFFISPILVQSCKKGCKRLHSAPEKMIFFEKREKNSVRNLQHLSVRL